ncbi:MAG: hypothetical protein M1826_001085 [Phylliscum demangeonii]|nr:MAG: hypothetical protein M1826_001085 [Phylliscum demangeonii]
MPDSVPPPKAKPKPAKGQGERRARVAGGFTVGPAHLPDGPYRRRVQKIKKDLIQKAKVKKSYAKIRQRELLPDPVKDDDRKQPAPMQPAPSVDLHPERASMLEEEVRETGQGPHGGDDDDDEVENAAHRPRRRQAKPDPFQRELLLAQARKAEAEERRRQRDEAEREREQKREARERHRRAMAKARTGGKNGQRKLGRESKMLLERVKKMVAETE